MLCLATATGEITANPTGGTGTKTYLWSTGATSKKVTGLAAGDYTVTVWDVTGTLLFRKDGDFPAGENTILLNLNGVVETRLIASLPIETPLGTATRLMLRMK